VNQTITWDALPDGWDGFELLIDDVERYVGSALNFSLASLNASIPHYFRLAVSFFCFAILIYTADSITKYTYAGESGDFTMPAVLQPDGVWLDPLPGPS
jgi:hypothetical protein